MKTSVRLFLEPRADLYELFETFLVTYSYGCFKAWGCSHEKATRLIGVTTTLNSAIGLCPGEVRIANSAAYASGVKHPQCMGQLFESRSVERPSAAIDDRSLRVFDYEPGNFRTYFTSPFDLYKERVGERFLVLHRDRAVERTLENFEHMYRIVFCDGTQATAWGHEVCRLRKR